MNKMTKDKNGSSVVRARGYFVQRSYIYDVQEKRDDGSLYIPPTAMSELDWREMITREWTEFAQQHVESGGLIFHDADIDPKTGFPVQIHVHAVFKFKNARTQSSIIKALGLTSTENATPVDSYVNSYRYLTHISETAINENKTIYSRDLLHMFNVNYSDVIVRAEDAASKRMDRTKVNDYIADLHLRIMHDGMTALEAKNALLSEFNSDPTAVTAYVGARQSFDKDMATYDEDRARDFLDNGRNLKTVYIQGEGGLGKTKLARAMASHKSDGRGYHPAVQKSEDKTFDFVDKYNGELVSVFDEIQPNTFQTREFLGVFDEHNYTPVSSRNTNKHWLANYAIFTNSVPLFDWRLDLIRYSQGGSAYVNNFGQVAGNVATESLFWQVTRRFASMVTIDKLDTDEIFISVYALNKSKRGYVYAGSLTAVSNFYENLPKDDVLLDGIAYNASAALAKLVWDLIEKGLAASHKPVVYDKCLDQATADIDLVSFGGSLYTPTHFRNSNSKVL